MKITYHLSFFYALLCTTAISMDVGPTPENTDLYFDIDEVLIEGSFTVPKLVLSGLMQEPLNSPAFIKSLLELDKVYQRNSNGLKEVLYDEHGNVIEGSTFHFLQHGLRDKNLTPYVPSLLTTLESSRRFITGTRKICTYLKNKKGYTINFATNKDHVSYELTAHALGPKFTSIPSKVFVAHPGNSKDFLDDIRQFAEQPTTPLHYRGLAHRALNIQESENIIHAPTRKPEPQYYQCLLKNSSTKQFVIFIDDIVDNTNGFNALQDNTPIRLHGIHFQDPKQLVNELVRIGILSEQDDHKFLKKIHEP